MARNIPWLVPTKKKNIKNTQKQNSPIRYSSMKCHRVVGRSITVHGYLFLYRQQELKEAPTVLCSRGEIKTTINSRRLTAVRVARFNRVCRACSTKTTTPTDCSNNKTLFLPTLDLPLRLVDQTRNAETSQFLQVEV